MVRYRMRITRALAVLLVILGIAWTLLIGGVASAADDFPHTPTPTVPTLP